MLKQAMTREIITTLATSGESETREFKETTGTRREATRTVCSFLNQRGGQVLFGVTQDGSVVGQQVSERTIEELSDELRRIDPPAFPTVERVRVDGDREVIVVSTGQGASRPYTYRGSAYRRVGNTNPANVRRRVQPDALRADAQRAALGEPARRRVVGRRP